MKWFQTSCEETNSFICKWTNATKPPPPPPSRCPEGWEDLGGENCYKLMLDQWVSWGEAHTSCWMEDGHDADLMSLHSKEEAALIAQRTMDSGANFWVGLARGGDGGFGWVDGTPFDLEYWLDGEPNSNGEDGEDCVEAYYVTAEWNDAYCSDLKGYVCMRSKLPEPTSAPTNPPTEQPTKPTKPEETTAKRPTYDPTEPTQDNGVDPTSGPSQLSRRRRLQRGRPTIQQSRLRTMGSTRQVDQGWLEALLLALSLQSSPALPLLLCSLSC